MFTRLLKTTLGALLLGALAPWAVAQGAYPDRPIRLVVPFSVGGGTDVVARIVAKALADRLGQPVVVENRAGAGSTLGTGQVARAPADGYTLLFASASHAFSPTVYRRLSYSQDDFAAIAVVNTTPLLLAAHPSVPARTLREFVALLKANPGKYDYGTSGKGTTLHMAAELFRTMAGVDAVHVPYKGEAPAMADLLGGQIAFMVNQASSVVPHLRSGRLIGLGVTTPKRLAMIPDVPTIAEAGVPGFAAYGWNVILAPRGTPAEIVSTLNRQINAVIALPEVRRSFDELGLDVLDPTTPESAAAFVASETAKWAPIIRAAGVQED
jgi:tripartite-type tricarboxylate transporter receptor subunit TctC